MRALLLTFIVLTALPAAVAHTKDAPVVNPYAATPPPTNVGSSMRPFAHKFQACRDKTMQTLVGLQREAAFKKVGEMRLMMVRVIHWRQPVNYEVVPERLTLVMSDTGQVVKAFCR
jgi:hypothetical protein